MVFFHILSRSTVKRKIEAEKNKKTTNNLSLVQKESTSPSNQSHCRGLQVPLEGAPKKCRSQSVDPCYESTEGEGLARI